MKISSKGRYAVRIIAEIKRHSPNVISASELSIKQGISLKYTEQILAILSKAKLIESTRGTSGGYKLSNKFENCSIADILKTTGDLPKLAPCLEKENSCSRKASCFSFKCWEKLNLLIVDYLTNLKIDDLLD